MKTAEIWRVNAYILTKKVLEEYGWSEAIEAMESHLLGYNEQQTTKWISEVSNQKASWKGLNVYFFLNTDQWNSSKALGEKSLEKRYLPNGIELYFMRKNVEIGIIEASKVDETIKIGRCSLERGLFSKFLGHIRH